MNGNIYNLEILSTEKNISKKISNSIEFDVLFSTFFEQRSTTIP
jgi:hypothetical protein